MSTRRGALVWIGSIVSIAALSACQAVGAAPNGAEPTIAFAGEANPKVVTPLVKTTEEWRAKLTREQFTVLRESGTERPFTGRHWNTKDAGVYLCAGCGLGAYASTAKFDSGTGWPSFTQPVAPDRVKSIRDTSHGMVRDEVRCARCDGHQGHVFDDGPAPTGLRYCINSAALVFASA